MADAEFLEHKDIYNLAVTAVTAGERNSLQRKKEQREGGVLKTNLGALSGNSALQDSNAEGQTLLLIADWSVFFLLSKLAYTQLLNLRSAFNFKGVKVSMISLKVLLFKKKKKKEQTERTKPINAFSCL